MTLDPVLHALQTKPKAAAAYYLAARSHGKVMGVPVAWLSKTALKAFTRKGAPMALIVSVLAQQLVLFSTTGEEGSRDQPRLAVTGHDAKPLVETLRKIAIQHWPHGERTAAERQIIVSFGPDQTAIQAVVSVAAAVRTTPDGRPIFPDVLLSD
jgi:hypothetical protein